jgi:hypothetical protein
MALGECSHCGSIFHDSEDCSVRIKARKLEAENTQLKEDLEMSRIAAHRVLTLDLDNLRLTQERDQAREALGDLYDKWENGDYCYEDPEDRAGYIGKAFNLSYDEENKILGLLNAERTQSTPVAEPQADPVREERGKDSGRVEWPAEIYRRITAAAEKPSEEGS